MINEAATPTKRNDDTANMQEKQQQQHKKKKKRRRYEKQKRKIGYKKIEGKKWNKRNMPYKLVGVKL